jgi:hypothetical protein
LDDGIGKYFGIGQTNSRGLSNIAFAESPGSNSRHSRTLHKRRISNHDDAGSFHITALSPYHSYAESHRSQLSPAKRQDLLGRWQSIQEFVIALVDTKVSIGTFVQLIRLLTSGSIKKPS